MGNWKKFTAFNSQPTGTTFPDLPDILTWVRLFLGLAYGISLGLRGQHGGVGIIFGLNVITFIPIIYVNSYLAADTDSYKGVNFVGVPNALALMLLVWIFLFSLAHSDEESSLAASVLDTAVKSVAPTEEESTVDASETIVSDESEF